MKNMSPKIYHDKIFYFESIIENAEEIIKVIEETNDSLTDEEGLTKWYEWTTSDGYVFGFQKQVLPRKLSDTREEIKNIVYQIESKLFEAGKYYAEALGIEYISPSNLSFSKYAQGKTMGPHVDSYDTPGVYPLMSGVIYLNESDGGELDFPEQSIRIKPKAGSIVIFPSVAPFYHQSLPVQSGWKYIAPVFWVKREL